MPPLIVYPASRLPQWLFFVAMVALLVGLGVGAVMMIRDTGDFTPVVGLLVLALAGVGFGLEAKKKLFGRRRSSEPVLVVDDHGIGWGRVRIPWNRIRHVDLQHSALGRRKRWADAITQQARFLDGSCRLVLRVADPGTPAVPTDNRHRLLGDQVQIVLDGDVPSARWPDLCEAVYQHARRRGVPTGAPPSEQLR